MAKSEGSPNGIVNEPLRLVLSPREQAFILARIAKAKHQLVYSAVIPFVYFGILYVMHVTGIDPPDTLVMIYFLAFFVVFGTTLYFFMSGTLDWIMFARYKRNHQAFLNRYNRL